MACRARGEHVDWRLRSAINQNVALAGFIPVVLGMGVMLEVRQQIIVRGLATGRVSSNLVLPICFETAGLLICSKVLLRMYYGMVER